MGLDSFLQHSDSRRLPVSREIMPLSKPLQLRSGGCYWTNLDLKWQTFDFLAKEYQDQVLRHCFLFWHMNFGRSGALWKTSDLQMRDGDTTTPIKEENSRLFEFFLQNHSPCKKILLHSKITSSWFSLQRSWASKETEITLARTSAWSGSGKKKISKAANLGIIKFTSFGSFFNIHSNFCILKRYWFICPFNSTATSFIEGFSCDKRERLFKKKVPKTVSFSQPSRKV